MRSGHLLLFCLLTSAQGAAADTKDIQTSLKAVGCYEGPVDGTPSLALRSATRCFQKGIDASPDGTLSASEEAQLHDMAAAGERISREERYVPQQIRGSDLYSTKPPRSAPVIIEPEKPGTQLALPDPGPDPTPPPAPSLRRAPEITFPLGTAKNVPPTPSPTPPPELEPQTSAAGETGRFSMDELRSLIARSRDASDKTVTASAPYPTDRFKLSTITISEDDRPVMSYSLAYYGALEALDVHTSFSCGSDGMLHFTAMLFAGGDGYALDPEAELSLLIYPANGRQHVVPIELIETLPDKRGLIRVHGAYSPSTSYFASMPPTESVIFVLQEDGRSVPYETGADFSTFASDIKPVIDACALKAPSAPARSETPRTQASAAKPNRAPDPSPREPSRPSPPKPEASAVSGAWTPTEADILAAIRREVEAKMAQIDAMARQCETVGETKNPFSAIACIGTGFGSFNSESMRWDVRSVSLGECVRSEKDFAYCRYTVDASFSGSGMMGQMSGLFNAAMALGGASYGRFYKRQGQWHLDRTYESCTWGDGKIHCEWTETR